MLKSSGSCGANASGSEENVCCNMGKFTPDDDRELIAIVKGFPVLFELNHPHFKSTVKKEKIWSEVGLKLNKTGESCKKRWKSIRDHIKRGKKESSAKRRKRAPYWDSLCFLTNEEDENKGQTTAELNEVEDVDQHSLAEETLDGLQHLEEMSEEEIETNVKQEAENLIQSRWEEPGNAPQLQSKEPGNSPRSKSTIRRLPLKRNKNVEAILKMLKQRVTEKNKRVACVERFLESESKPQENENDLFFKSMAAIVNKLDAIKQAQARRKVFAIVSDLELEQLSGCSD